MVKTQSVYDPAETTDGQRILVTRFWPRGISEARLSAAEWMREVAPSKELLEDWKSGRISWDEYTVPQRAAASRSSGRTGPRRSPSKGTPSVSAPHCGADR